jgi:predicted phage terminase large subunit-like protein
VNVDQLARMRAERRSQVQRLRAGIHLLSPDDREYALRIIRESEAPEKPADFIRRVSPHHPPPRHIQPILDLFERGQHEQIRACLSMPPGSAKTLSILRCLAWWMQYHGGDINAYLTYSADKAMFESRRARGFAADAGVEFGESDAMGAWENNEGGYFLAAGAGGGIMGRRISGWCVYDDPYKNREEADSDIVNQRLWETLTEVIVPRMEGGNILVVMQRWNPDDLVGRIVDELDWEYISLPALAEENDPLGRQVGEALWADNPLYTAEQLAKIRDVIGEWSFSALYQGRPRPRGHNVFGIESYHQDNGIDGHRIVLYGDPAASRKTTADYGVMLALAVKGRRDQQTAKVLDLYRKQMTVPEYARTVRAFQQRWNNAPLWVESVGAFKAVPQILLEVDPGLRVKEHQPVGDKFQRAQGVAAAWNSGRVTVPFGAPWVPEFLAEVQNFTGVNDRYDDQVDCLSGAWNCAINHHSAYGV